MSVSAATDIMLFVLQACPMCLIIYGILSGVVRQDTRPPKTSVGAAADVVLFVFFVQACRAFWQPTAPAGEPPRRSGVPGATRNVSETPYIYTKPRGSTFPPGRRRRDYGGDCQRKTTKDNMDAISYTGNSDTRSGVCGDDVARQGFV